MAKFLLGNYALFPPVVLDDGKIKPWFHNDPEVVGEYRRIGTGLFHLEMPQWDVCVLCRDLVVLEHMARVAFLHHQEPRVCEVDTDWLASWPAPLLAKPPRTWVVDGCLQEGLAEEGVVKVFARDESSGRDLEIGHMQFYAGRGIVVSIGSRTFDAVATLDEARDKFVAYANESAGKFSEE